VAVLALDHVQLAMPAGGEEQARQFYAGLLGMEEIPKPASLRVNGGVWFRAGGAELHLGIEADFHPARKAHPALRVSELGSLANRLEEAGHAISWDDRYPGVRRFYVNDPFGNRLEALQPEG
jgi:catechol 2,3-dioxygenase-like lactoylglutathione lyase family enzyme